MRQGKHEVTGSQTGQPSTRCKYRGALRTRGAVLLNSHTNASPPSTGACYLLPAQMLTLTESFYKCERRYELPATASLSSAIGKVFIHTFQRGKCSGALWLFPRVGGPLLGKVALCRRPVWRMQIMSEPWKTPPVLALVLHNKSPKVCPKAEDLVSYHAKSLKHRTVSRKKTW